MMLSVMYGVVELFYIFFYVVILLLEVFHHNKTVGKNEEEIFKRVKKGIVRFDPEDWGKVSNEAKKLI